MILDNAIRRYLPGTVVIAIIKHTPNSFSLSRSTDVKIGLTIAEVSKKLDLTYKAFLNYKLVRTVWTLVLVFVNELLMSLTFEGAGVKLIENDEAVAMDDFTSANALFILGKTCAPSICKDDKSGKIADRDGSAVIFAREVKDLRDETLVELSGRTSLPKNCLLAVSSTIITASLCNLPASEFNH